MLRWQLSVFRTDPMVVGDFASAEVTQEQLLMEKDSGHQIPMVTSLCLDHPKEGDFAQVTKEVFEVFEMRNKMVVNGTDVVNIFCHTPCINIDLKVNNIGEIVIANHLPCDLTQKQIEALIEFAEFLRERGWLFQR